MRRVNTGNPGSDCLPSDFIHVIAKLPIAMEAGWRYDAARHRLPASFSNVIGEPGHTKPHTARLRQRVSYRGLFWVCASQ